MAYHDQYDETVSIGDWVGSMVLSSIPVVGFIMMLVWAFGSNAKPSKRNFFRAYLILWVVGLVLSVIFFFMIPGMLTAVLNAVKSFDPMGSGFYN